MRTATLIITQPGHAARTLEISAGEVSIGRALDNTLCLEGDGRVALYHALIVAREGGHWLLDLGSPHETTVNGESVEGERQLRDGDTIGIGYATIEFYADESAGASVGEQAQRTQARRPANRRARLAPVVGVGLGLALTLAVALLFVTLRGDGGQVTAVRAPAAVPAPMSLADVETLARNLAGQISSRNDYVFDREFLEQVRQRTGDYRDEGFSRRARDYRDVINDAFVGEQGLAAPLGYVLAMSRSRFRVTSDDSRREHDDAQNVVQNAAQDDAGQGLWRLSPTLAANTGYIGRCGAGTLAEPDQRCSAAVAATYMKFLTVDLFAGDFVCAVASFGLSPHEAARFRAGLGDDRRDFWKVLESPAQRERVVRFFAAGIVGENPQQFGLSQDGPLSELYPQR